nr:DNA-binding protein [Serratia sp. 14-2641]
MYDLYFMYCVYSTQRLHCRHYPSSKRDTVSSLPPDTVRRIEDAAAALIAAGTPNPTNEQVRQHLGGGSLSHISPVMRAFRARQRERASEQAPALPPELLQLLTGQLGLLWQAACKQADADTLAAREQADADIAQADQERDTALAQVATLESELAVLREVVTERDRLLAEVRELRAEALPLREQVARLTATGEHQAAQLQETKAELKAAREENRTLQGELLALARQELTGGNA